MSNTLASMIQPYGLALAIVALWYIKKHGDGTAR